jgi:putative acetyltransferase
MKTLTVRAEAPVDVDAIAQVNRAAFGQPDEADLIARLRADGDVVASLVAAVDGEVVGHVLFSRLAIETEHGAVAAAALAPMAVLPAQQRRGVGTALVRGGLKACEKSGIEAVVVLGHEDYYPRFGFSPDMAGGLEAPFSGPAFMALELKPGVLRGHRGRVTYAKGLGL